MPGVMTGAPCRWLGARSSALLPAERKPFVDLTSKAIIVTASTSGVGAAVARRLAGLGAGIVVNSAASVEAGQRLASELSDAVYVQGCIGRPPTAPALVAPPQQRWRRRVGLAH